MLGSGGESKKEGVRDSKPVDSELAHGRVSKFYFGVVIKSLAWRLVSLIL